MAILKNGTIWRDILNHWHQKKILENIFNILVIIVPVDDSARLDAGILFEKVMASC